MAATPGKGEMAKRGERQDVARALSTTDGRLARSPLSHELSRRCCLCGDRERYIYTTELKQAWEQAKEPSPCLLNQNKKTVKIFIKICVIPLAGTTYAPPVGSAINVAVSI